MPTYTKRFLSESADGTGIICTSIVTTSGTLIHTAVAGSASSVDEVWLWAGSLATALVPATRDITIQFGGTNTANQIRTRLGNGLRCVCPGLLLRNGLTVRAVCTATGSSTPFVVGYVNRIAT